MKYVVKEDSELMKRLESAENEINAVLSKYSLRLEVHGGPTYIFDDTTGFELLVDNWEYGESFPRSTDVKFIVVNKEVLTAYENPTKSKEIG